MVEVLPYACGDAACISHCALQLGDVPCGLRQGAECAAHHLMHAAHRPLDAAEYHCYLTIPARLHAAHQRTPNRHLHLLERRRLYFHLHPSPHLLEADLAHADWLAGVAACVLVPAPLDLGAAHPQCPHRRYLQAVVPYFPGRAQRIHTEHCCIKKPRSDPAAVGTTRPCERFRPHGLAEYLRVTQYILVCFSRMWARQEMLCQLDRILSDRRKLLVSAVRCLLNEGESRT
mmetsp:Transcript_8665/g.26020  ORF Transcript_8665/g.26020 Transcript_8665/m.26020 type:complete len:231 (+) Transcript_8665:2279-2971(+)